VFEIKELTTPTYSGVLEDKNGDPVALDNLVTLRMTYYDVASGEIINSRDHQGVLNANQVTVHDTNGTVTWAMLVEDTTLLSEASAIEKRRALFEWATDDKVGHWEVAFWILNREHLPA